MNTETKTNGRGQRIIIPPVDKPTEEDFAITPPKFKTLKILIRGTAPYVQLRFSEKAMNTMTTKMELGDLAKGKKKREARDFQADYIGAMHLGENGENGMPASAFRNACISACRTVGFKMTLAKLSVFIEADFFDKVDGTPLVEIHGTPQLHKGHVRLATGVADIRIRAMWKTWHAYVRCRYDSEQFTKADVIHLFSRVGMQVGIGEGRPDSKASCGMGWGLFAVEAAESFGK